METSLLPTEHWSDKGRPEWAAVSNAKTEVRAEAEMDNDESVLGGLLNNAPTLKVQDSPFQVGRSNINPAEPIPKSLVTIKFSWQNVPGTQPDMTFNRSIEQLWSVEQSLMVIAALNSEKIVPSFEIESVTDPEERAGN
jgi:hypothetical protein